MSPDDAIRRARWLANQAHQQALDALLVGNPLARAALAARHEPIQRFWKEGPDAGEREEVQSHAGRVN